VRLAGYIGPELFDQGARKLLFKISHGVPRVINVLCNKAMMLAYASGEFHVQKKHIEAAALDSKVSVPAQSDEQGGSFGLQFTMLGILLAAVFLMGLYQ
jgi:MSHA biogenesis protein MshM